MNTMTQVTLGKTEITIPKNGFGALPIQRVEKLGEAFSGIAKNYADYLKILAGETVVD